MVRVSDDTAVYTLVDVVASTASRVAPPAATATQDTFVPCVLGTCGNDGKRDACSAALLVDAVVGGLTVEFVGGAARARNRQLARLRVYPPLSHFPADFLEKVASLSETA